MSLAIEDESHLETIIASPDYQAYRSNFALKLVCNGAFRRRYGTLQPAQVTVVSRWLTAFAAGVDEAYELLAGKEIPKVAAISLGWDYREPYDPIAFSSVLGGQMGDCRATDLEFRALLLMCEFAHQAYPSLEPKLSAQFADIDKYRQEHQVEGTSTGLTLAMYDPKTRSCIICMDWLIYQLSHQTWATMLIGGIQYGAPLTSLFMTGGEEACHHVDYFQQLKLQPQPFS